MIRLNFIAEEQHLQRARALRTRAVLGYGAMWVAMLMYFFAARSHSLTLLRQHEQRIAVLSEKAGQIIPTFQQAVRLLKERTAMEKELAALQADMYEPAFVADLFAGLEADIAGNMWLESLDFAPAYGKQSRKKGRNKNAVTGHVLQVKGFVLLAPRMREQDTVQRFYHRLQNRLPFSMAEGKMRLDDLRVAKIEEQYYYNFALSFAWPATNVK